MHLVRRQMIFTAGMLIVGCLEAAVAAGWVGSKGAEGVLYSIVLCLVPGWLTIYAADLLKHHELSAYVVLVGTGLRVIFVILGMIAVGVLRPDLGLREFTIWLIIAYMQALGLETWLVLKPSLDDSAD